MRVRSSTLLAAALLGLVACRAPTDGAPRAERPLFKGVELYSWPDPATREWRFVLLPGTNREKSAPEVLAAPGVLRSARALETRIAGLARGESVAWVVRRPAFPLPGRAVVRDVVAAGAEAGVVVEVAER